MIPFICKGDCCMNKLINKKYLSEAVSEKCDLTRALSRDIIDCVFDEISDALANGHSVEVANFGKFSVKERKERMGINPKTKEKVAIKASKAPAFKPGKALKDLVNK